MTGRGLLSAGNLLPLSQGKLSQVGQLRNTGYYGIQATGRHAGEIDKDTAVAPLRLAG